MVYATYLELLVADASLFQQRAREIKDGCLTNDTCTSFALSFGLRSTLRLSLRFHHICIRRALITDVTIFVPVNKNTFAISIAVT